MNIYSKPGTKIVFAYPEHGYNFDKENCVKYLILGETYTISQISVGNSRTEIELKEVPEIVFNSVNFEDVEDSDAKS